ncbi:MAG: isoprenylcysteine carboxylmethyltransferase family protein [Anaerolineae bacterium]
MYKPLIFLAGSLLLILFSRASLLKPRSHGFYRFFAWEAILALALLNLDCWFCNPLAWYRLVSWLLLALSLLLVVHGARLLREMGKPDERRKDEALIGFEKTTRLVTAGAYRYIRHPLYSSLLFLAWGVFFKDPSWVGGLLAATASLFLTLTARVEEEENIRFFGPAYEEYRRRSKMFIPYIF